jgi:hypothetical protein
MGMSRIQKEIKAFFDSDEGKQVVGQIVLNAVNQALKRDIQFEDGKSEPGRVVEKTETWNLLDWLVKYMPHVEAAIRGCQADSAKARNRAVETRDALKALGDLYMHREAVEVNQRKHIE